MTEHSPGIPGPVAQPAPPSEDPRASRHQPLADGLVITVYGRPVTQGAIRSLGKGRPSVHANAERLRPWREAVKQAALDALAAPAPGHSAAVDVHQLLDSAHSRSHGRLEGPVSVAVAFTFDRPKSAPRSRPCWPITRSSGDLDKLVRAVLDALTDAGVWRDDAQVVRLQASKAHVGDPWSLRVPGAVLTVRGLGGASSSLPVAAAGDVPAAGDGGCAGGV